MLITATWVPVVRKTDVGANKNVTADTQSVPELDTILDGDAITDDHIVFDEAMRADVAVLAYSCARQHYNKLPDMRAIADIRCLYISRWVNFR